MRLCADATEAELQEALLAVEGIGEFWDLRPPEVGLVMLQGRTGGDGPAFNVGEATVTRAVVQLASGETGYGYVLGSATARARLAAVVDAVGQHPVLGPRMKDALTAIVGTRRTEQRQRVQEETAATRVSFFTLVRGED